MQDIQGPVAERVGAVSVVRLGHGAGMNAMDPGYLGQLGKVVRAALDDDEVRAVVLAGSERAFSAGADVAAMHASAKRGEADQWVLEATRHLHPILQALQDDPKPSVAAVGGVAAGGGLGLALACDARIGSPQARLAAGYFGLGLSPDGGATWLLPRLVGIPRARRFFFGNEVMDASAALACGALDEVVPSDVLLDRAVAVAQEYGRWARCSRGATKRLLGMALHMDLASQMEAERGFIAAAAAAPDFLEGTGAFLAKRPPRFA